MEGTKILQGIEFGDPVVQVLSKTTVIISFKAAARMVLKNGTEELDINTSTFVWQKTSGKWKIVHIHESKSDLLEYA